MSISISQTLASLRTISLEPTQLAKHRNPTLSDKDELIRLRSEFADMRDRMVERIIEKARAAGLFDKPGFDLVAFEVLATKRAQQHLAEMVAKVIRNLEIN